MLRAVSFEVKRGEIVGLVGANGAGKTSLFLCLAGVYQRRNGTVSVAGLDPSRKEERKKLPAHVGIAMARDLLLSARAVTAQEALRMGLVGRVVPDGTALEEAVGIAEVICENGPLSVEAIKRSVRAAEGLPEDEALKIELEIGWPVFATDDAKEGARAFAEKRPARFQRR